jgi:hypothetical protein
MKHKIEQRFAANTRSESNEFCRQSANVGSFAQVFNNEIDFYFVK